MSRESTILAGRRFAEESLTTTASFRRETGRAARSATTGRQAVETEALFDSPCKIKVGSLGSLIPTSRERRDYGREITTERSIIVLPVDAPATLPNDLFDVTGVGDYDDPQLLGQTFRIVAPIAQTYATSRRFAIESVLS